MRDGDNLDLIFKQRILSKLWYIGYMNLFLFIIKLKIEDKKKKSKILRIKIIGERKIVVEKDVCYIIK